MLDRVGGEHVKLAEDVDREPRVWNQVIQERAAIEAEFSGRRLVLNSDFPVTATREQENDGIEADEQGDHEDDQEAEDAVLSEEQHPGTAADTGNAIEPQGAIPVQEQYQGVDFTVVGEIHIPPRRSARPKKPVLRLQHCVVQEPDIVGDSIIIQSDTRPDPARIVLSPTAVVGDARDEIERQYGLQANWARKSALNDTRCRNVRAFVYREGSGGRD